MALKEFMAVINREDVARSNRFVVEVQPPQGSGLSPSQNVNLLCQDVTFPGQNMRTATDDLRQGPTREIAQGVTYGSINMTFICTPGLPEKLFFEAWQKLMFNSVTWQAKYYREYIGQIKLRELDRKDRVRYGIILYEAFPKIINAQDYSNTSSDAIQTLQIEFAFHHWARDNEVYGQEAFFGSRESDEGKALPTRRVLAGTEEMSAEEAMAFIRGETRNTLGQTYSEAMAAAGGGSGAGQVASNLLTGGAANIGVFKGYQQAFATLPAAGKHKGGNAVDAEKVPAQKKINDGVKTTMTKKQLYASGKYEFGSLTDEDVARINGQVAYATTPTTKGHGKTTGADLPKARAAAWVNPNTGESVGGGKVNVGATLSSMRSTMGQFFPGSYSGSLASTSSGVLKQAQAASISRSVGGVKISASISLGGGGGGMSNLISPRGLMSGIGIPRFGGIPAVRGAGFQVRSVASRGGRANHNAEGGESGDGRDDR